MGFGLWMACVLKVCRKAVQRRFTNYSAIPAWSYGTLYYASAPVGFQGHGSDIKTLRKGVLPRIRRGRRRARFLRYQIQIDLYCPHRRQGLSEELGPMWKTLAGNKELWWSGHWGNDAASSSLYPSLFFQIQNFPIPNLTHQRRPLWHEYNWGRACEGSMTVDSSDIGVRCWGAME